MACCFHRCFSLFILLSSIFGIFLLDMTPFAPTYRVKPVRPLYGPLTRNNILDSTEKLFEGKVGTGPEAIAIRDGKLYTGLQDGRIIEIDGNKIRTIVKIGKDDCDTDKSCGRPLGMRFDSTGSLIVADHVKGIYKVNVKSGAVVSLVLSSTKIDGKKIGFADDVVITKTGDIYFTDCFKVFPFWQILYKHAPKGRILHYNPKTKKVTTVLDKLYMPNGLELSRDEDYLIFCQTLESNILKYYLQGPKKGTAEILIDDLPGLPDNIRATSRGTYWVAMPTIKLVDEPSLFERVTCHFSKYIIYSSMQLVANALELSRKYLPLDILNVIYDSVHGYIEGTLFHFVTYGMVIEVNDKGEIIRSLHSPKGAVHMITHAIEHDHTLYLGSFWNTYIGKLKLH